MVKKFLSDKMKNTSELLRWCKDIELTEKQEEEIIRYIGELELIIKEQRQTLDIINRITQKSKK